MGHKLDQTVTEKENLKQKFNNMKKQQKEEGAYEKRVSKLVNEEGTR